MLFENREGCISFRPGRYDDSDRGQKVIDSRVQCTYTRTRRTLTRSHPAFRDLKDHAMLEVVQEKPILHEPIEMSVLAADVSQRKRRVWTKRIGMVGAFVQSRSVVVVRIRLYSSRISSLARDGCVCLRRVVFNDPLRITTSSPHQSAPKHVDASVLVGVHTYDALPPTETKHVDDTSSSYAYRPSSKEQYRSKKARDDDDDGYANEAKFQRVVVVGESADAPFVPQFAPAPYKQTEHDEDGDTLLWFRRRDVHPDIGGSEPIPYVSYADFLQNRLARSWIDRRQVRV